MVLDVVKEEIADTWYIGPDGSQINVYDFTNNDTSFFAATEEGIFYASIDHPNLADFSMPHMLTRNISLSKALPEIYSVFSGKEAPLQAIALFISMVPNGTILKKATTVMLPTCTPTMESW